MSRVSLLLAAPLHSFAYLNLSFRLVVDAAAPKTTQVTMDLDVCVLLYSFIAARPGPTKAFRCMRALYFNPFPLVVLDSDRHIRMINWPAEKVRFRLAYFEFIVDLGLCA